MELYSTNDIQEANLIIQSLKNNEIEAQLLDANTVQLAPHLSKAIGGIKIIVSENDFHEAIAILEQDFGIIYTDANEVKGYEEYILNWTNKLPIINKFRPSYQILATSGILLLIVSIILIALNTPSTKERLTKTDWCIRHMIFEGKERYPNTIEQLMLVINGANCQEKIKFGKGNGINLPGFETPKINGVWDIKDKTVTIHDVDNFPKFYNGVYKVDFTYQGDLILKSDKLEIICFVYSDNIRLPF
jgi:Putative prokaryotic signal transducing protein